MWMRVSELQRASWKWWESIFENLCYINLGFLFNFSLSITNSRSLLKLMSIESVLLSNHLILCHPLLLLPSIFPSTIVFSSDSVLSIRWPKYWSFSISPSNEYSGLISFKIDWLGLLAVKETLKSLLQHHSSKASILSVLSFLYGPTLIFIHDYWKNHSFDYD